MTYLEGLKLPELFGGKVNNSSDWACRREELLDIMKNELYGYSPAAPEKVDAKLVYEDDEGFAGKAIHTKYELCFETEKGPFSFPFTYVAPSDGKAHPTFIYISFSGDVPCRYLPAEELIDNGFAFASFDYKAVTSDTPEIDGLALMYDMTKYGGASWGKIGMWAFAASRIMDFISTLPEVDENKVAVVGHSRLGKTALWAGALDERFILSISNDSGCGGAAINRGKVGEQLSGMTKGLYYWFCPNMKGLLDVSNDDLRFDAHFLLSLLAPRYLLVGSAEKDEWADPKNEFLACRAASCAWELFGKKGFIADSPTPVLNHAFHTGEVGYHLRGGTHFMSRTDWNYYMDFRKKHNI